MKRFLFAFMAILLVGMVLVGAPAWAVMWRASDARSTASADSERAYKLVRVEDAATGADRTVSDGAVLVWSVVSDDGVTVTTVTDASGDNAVAGVAAESIATGDFGLMQVFGPHPRVLVQIGNANGDCEAGDLIFAHATDGRGGCDGTAVSTDGLQIVGIAYDAQATTGAQEVQAFLKGNV